MNRNLRLFYFLLFATAIAAGLRYYSQMQSSELVGFSASDFAVVDTASVNRIFIADKDGGQALLERIPGERYWSLNGEHKARKDAVDLLLKTFKRIAVQRPVSESELDNVNRLLAGRAKKVEIYQGGDQPVKTWYIGTSTQSHTGTYMVLGDGSMGIADEPFVTHMEGFTGFLSTRFFTEEVEWRYTGMFDFPSNTLRKVEVSYHETPEWSHTIEVDSVGGLAVLRSGKSLRAIDTLTWQNRFNLFRKIHLETFNNHLSPEGLATLSATKPALTLRAWNWDATSPEEIELFWKDPIMDTYNDAGELNQWDGARMYARYRDEFVLVQRFVFDDRMAVPADIKNPRLR
ncbi:MAG: hypothetical protein OSA78_07210 [Flavobacteriales bacterium]|nr:hypothetical protein [Flavobacteriales bacterium]